MSNEARPKKGSKQKAALDVDSARAAILEKLQKAGAKGTFTLAAKAASAFNEPLFGEAFDALERQDAIFIDRSSGRAKYFLKQFAPVPGKLILDKLRQSGAKGSTLITASTSPAKRAVIEVDAASLESQGVIVVDRSGKKPKYFLREFAPQPPRRPSLEEVCAHLEEWAASKYPQLLSESDLEKQLTKAEAPQFTHALYWLESQRELIRLEHKTKVFFVSTRALRKAIDPETEATHEPARVSKPDFASSAIDTARIREAYGTLTSQSGFPSVKIDRLQRESEVALPALQNWLREEHQQGRAVLSFGDWSLSEECTRAAAIELRGDRYLLVRLLS